MATGGIISAMIEILRTGGEGIRQWSESEWQKANDFHYGESTEWPNEKFYFEAQENGKLAGYVACEYAAGVLYISTLIVGETFRRRGIGRTLLQKAEEYGKDLGAHTIWLKTGKNWPENKFYEKLGYGTVATLPDFYFHQDFVIYSKSIK